MTSAALRMDQGGVGDNADELNPGTKLLMGQFTIESFVNSGGFGIVYLARDSLDRRVVIKECFPSSFCRRIDTAVGARSRSRQDEFRSIVGLFMQEAYNLSKLHHPGIVKVFQVFEDNETAYMAMDYIKGPDLLETVEGSAPALEPGQIMALLVKMLDAVGYVHAQGLLHRDISPDNILLDEATGNPVLIDFGASRKEVTRKSRAVSGLRVVKDGYSPQEFYISGSKQAPYSDLYALAATFYHLISQETPKTSQERLSAIAGHEGDPLRPLAGRFKAYPAAFLQAIDKAMSIFPRDRIQSVDEWRELIKAVIPQAAPKAVQREVSVRPGPTVASAQSPIPAMPLARARTISAPALQAAAPAMASGVVSRGGATTRGPRHLLLSSTAAVLLFVGLLSLPGSLLDGGRSLSAATAQMALAAEAPMEIPAERSRAVRLPFVPAPDAPNLVAEVLPGSPVWMKPGQRIVEINGEPVREGVSLQAMLADGADLAQLADVTVIIGYEAKAGADIIRKSEKLAVVNLLELPSGLAFETIDTPTGTQTVAAKVPASAVTDLKVGDMLLIYAPSGETLGTPTALENILGREIAKGVATYSFTVQRSNTTLDAAFRLGTAG
jgi:serine/threonine protein kinase